MRYPRFQTLGGCCRWLSERSWGLQCESSHLSGHFLSGQFSSDHYPLALAAPRSSGGRRAASGIARPHEDMDSRCTAPWSRRRWDLRRAYANRDRTRGIAAISVLIHPDQPVPVFFARTHVKIGELAGIAGQRITDYNSQIALAPGTQHKKLRGLLICGHKSIRVLPSAPVDPVMEVRLEANDQRARSAPKRWPDPPHCRTPQRTPGIPSSRRNSGQDNRHRAVRA